MTLNYSCPENPQILAAFQISQLASLILNLGCHKKISVNLIMMSVWSLFGPPNPINSVSAIISADLKNIKHAARNLGAG